MKRDKLLYLSGDWAVIESRIAGMLWAYTLIKDGVEVATYYACSSAHRDMERGDDGVAISFDGATILYGRSGRNLLDDYGDDRDEGGGGGIGALLKR